MYESTHEICLSSRNPYFDYMPNSGNYSNMVFHVPNINLIYCKYAKIKVKRAEFPNVFPNITPENNNLTLDLLNNRNNVVNTLVVAFPTAFYNVFEIMQYIEDRSNENNWGLNVAYNNQTFRLTFSLQNQPNLRIRVSNLTTIHQQLGLVLDSVGNPLIATEPVELLAGSNLYILTHIALNKSYCTQAEILYFTQVPIDVAPGEMIIYTDDGEKSSIVPKGLDLRYIPITLLDANKKQLNFQYTHWKIFLEITYVYDNIPTVGDLNKTLEELVFIPP